MSKRRNRRKSSAPNLPQETLERARREAGLSPEEADEAADIPEELEEDEAPEIIAEDDPVAALPARSEERPRSRRRRDEPAAVSASQRARRRRKEVPVEELTHEEIVERLRHPTKQVTDEELREQYSYVVGDLRSMILLSAVLFITLIVIAGTIIL